MSSTEQFWQYAEEALLLALSAESEDDRKSLVELAQAWTHVAMLERQLPDKPTVSVGSLAAVS
jgi:hypothetical protein